MARQIETQIDTGGTERAGSPRPSSAAKLCFLLEVPRIRLGLHNPQHRRWDTHKVKVIATNGASYSKCAHGKTKTQIDAGGAEIAVGLAQLQTMCLVGSAGHFCNKKKPKKTKTTLLSLLGNLGRLTWVKLQQPQEQRYPVLQVNAGSFRASVIH